jgi:hypothetical protein
MAAVSYHPLDAEGLVNPKVRAQQKDTDFGYPRACRFRKHQIENGFLELCQPTFFKTWFKFIFTFFRSWNTLDTGILTIYITVFVTRGRHFGARESVWSYFFEAKPRKNISKTDSRASKWLPRSQKQCWIKLYLTFGSKMDQYYNMAQGSS